jgi:hypothetical protein
MKSDEAPAVFRERREGPAAGACRGWRGFLHFHGHAAPAPGAAIALQAYADKFAKIRRVSSFMKAISADEMSCMARR